MRSLLRALLGLLAVISLTACQATLNPTTPGVPSGMPASVDPDPSPPDSGVTIDPGWITRPALTCGDPERRFPPEALGGLGLAELELDPAADVLRSILAEPLDSPFPDTGWHRVLDDPEGVTFVAAGDEATPWWTVAVGLLGGTVQATEYGECRLQPVAPDGVMLGDWWLDPDRPLPTPDSVEIAIVVRERACASAASPEGRILAPTIVVGAETIAAAIGIVQRPGAQECPGNPEYPTTLTLPEPLGNRTLLDASSYPPRTVTQEPQ
jgi:hypothetical protein